MSFTKTVTALALPLRLIPDAVHSRLLAATCSHLVRGLKINGRLRDLEGKTIQIHVSDIPISYRLSIRAGGLHSNPAVKSDVCISGTLADFWLLATRAEDPDMLFFNRRLVIEGDTETGLYIKNLLDSIEFDWQTQFTAVTGQSPPELLQRIIARAQKRIARMRHRVSGSSSWRTSMPGSPYQ